MSNSLVGNQRLVALVEELAPAYVFDIKRQHFYYRQSA